jgi:hypothetical protein
LLASKQPFQLLHRASGGDDGELSLFHFHEFNAISSVEPKRGAEGDGDLPF